MATYTASEQAALDQKSGIELDAQAEALRARIGGAITLLYVHGIITDGERIKARKRFESWTF